MGSCVSRGGVSVDAGVQYTLVRTPLAVLFPPQYIDYGGAVNALTRDQEVGERVEGSAVVPQQSGGAFLGLAQRRATA
ncbi:hypothetical protein [Streptomyces silvisoli]|uniref:Uncharacterized protein n=1 Tax=Streptomyces silvisoli TaxID=3034235 RepID=A0ABT5ZSV2_9ACTN|nr:hypothetical protein [Streptomyces silvisoli]MDF3292599.1 hypothetical protein [Streptomyces silvisoli]